MIVTPAEARSALAQYPAFVADSCFEVAVRYFTQPLNLYLYTVSIDRFQRSPLRAIMVSLEGEPWFLDLMQRSSPAQRDEAKKAIGKLLALVLDRLGYEPIGRNSKDNFGTTSRFFTQNALYRERP